MSKELKSSLRAEIVERRTYRRPKNKEGTILETAEEALDRTISHQKWLWERAKAGFTKNNNEWILSSLTESELDELEELKKLIREKKVSLSGRTKWLGGTEVSRRRESSQFNCAFLEIRTVNDLVDTFWLLLQGCGVGFKPILGALNGFTKEIETIRTIEPSPENICRKTYPDKDINYESWDPKTFTWTIKIGDSAEAWAKSIGKLLAGKYPAKTLVLDFSDIREEGQRLKGYGWISSGHRPLLNAYTEIVKILNRKRGQLLSNIDILDIVNYLGTVLSTRRSAQIALVDFFDKQWEDFALAKKEHWVDNPQRAQSNNSIVFHKKPRRSQLEKIFQLMEEAGGSEPGFINAEQAGQRAPWYKGLNPCAEILLGSNSFCNLVEINLSQFPQGEYSALLKATKLVARANYRQTLVNLDDGILQRSWHESNEFLHLCGVGVTGVVTWPHAHLPDAWQDLKAAAQQGCHSMADELYLPRSKAVTTIKPSGTVSKTMGMEGREVPEGIHKPLGKYIFNNIAFSKHDPLISKFKQANYEVREHPYDPTAYLVKIPVCYEGIDFDIGITNEIVESFVPASEVIREVNQKFISVVEVFQNPSQHGYIVRHHKEVEVNQESAIKQLERYKIVMQNYVDHNCSITISYSPSEVPFIIDWLMKNWDTYVGVSFIYRNDPTKSAKDLGYEYLPQEVVDQEEYNKYVATLRSIDFEGTDTVDQVDEDDCQSGACPIR